MQPRHATMRVVQNNIVFITKTIIYTKFIILDMPQKPVDEQIREEQGVLSFDATHRIMMLRYLDLSQEHLQRRHRYKRLIELQYDQR